MPVQYYTKRGLIAWKRNMLEAIPTSFPRDSEPNFAMVDYYTRIFNESSAGNDKLVVQLIFNNCNDYTNRNHIFARVITLNYLYSTNLSRDKIDLLTNLITIMIDNTHEVNAELATEICQEFQRRYTGNYNPYSFITKYFHFLNPVVFPIYDSYVETMLKWYKELFDGFTFNDDNLKDYNEFIDILRNFISRFNLNCTLETVDMYLWTAGKEFFPQYPDPEILAQYKPPRQNSNQ